MACIPRTPHPVYQQGHMLLLPFMLLLEEDITQLVVVRRHNVFTAKVNIPPTTCSEVTDQQKRLEIVRKANLCFKCLGNHKISSQCNSKFQCKHCRNKHHTSLCEPTDHDTPKSSKQEADTPVQPHSQQPAQQVNANAAPVLHGIHNNKEIPLMTVTLLKTAIAPVIGEGIRI